MKNLNKKIGVVALAAMMLVGGVAASGIKVQANGPSIGNMVNAKADIFVHKVCSDNDAIIVANSKNPHEIDSFLDKHYPKLKRRLIDLSASFDRKDEKGFKEYIELKRKEIEEDRGAKHLYRVKFGIEEYLILFNKLRPL